jgi:type IV secretion system protein VirD4
MEFCDAPPVQRCLATSSFDPRVLRSGRASLYLCLPHSKVQTLAPLMRLWVGTLLRVLSSDKTGERDKVLFLLDEAAHLGRMSILEDAVTLYRSMGIRLWFAFQSLHQVKTTFGDKADTILDNIGTQQFFGVSNFDAAEAISKRIGERTIRLFSANKSWSRSRPTGSTCGPGGPPPGSDSYSESFTTSDAGRPLLRPEEIMLLADDESLVFHNNLPVVATRLIRYYEHRSFKRGGIGKPRRLGLAAGLASACILTLSVALYHIAATLPPP